jgi:hypothetical protein
MQRIGELHEETHSQRPIRVTHHAHQATSEILSYEARKASKFWEQDTRAGYVRICEGPRVNTERHEKEPAPPNRWIANSDSNK